MSASVPGLFRRHLATSSGASVAIAVLVFVLSGIAAFGPLLLADVRQSTLEYRLDGMTSLQRDLEASGSEIPPLIGGATDPAHTPLPEDAASTWGFVEAELQRFRDEAPAAIRPVLGDPRAVLVLGRTTTENRQAFRVFPAMDPRYADVIDIVEGAAPSYPTPRPDDDFFEQELPTTVEIALSVATAEKFDWEVGEARAYPALAGGAGSNFELAYLLTGTYQAADSTDPYWAHVTGLLEPSSVFDGENQEYVTAVGYVDPRWAATLAWPMGSTAEMTYWYPFEQSAITDATATAAAQGLRSFTGVSHRLGENTQTPMAWGIRFHSEAIDVLDRAIVETTSLTAIILMIVSGPFGVSLAVLVLATRMLQERRRSAFELLAARGASGWQVRRLAMIEGLLVALMPAALGAAAGVGAALTLFGGAVSPMLSPALYAVPALLAVFPAVVLAASATPRARTARVDRPRRSIARAVLEAAIVMITVIALVALFSRGVGTGGIDPLVTATPLLLTLSVCVITLRIYPLGLHLLHGAMRRRSGLVGFLGSARALRDPATGVAPVLALVVGMTIAVSSGILLSSLQAGVVDASQRTAGADLQLQLSRFPDGAAGVVDELPGVAEVVPVTLVRSVELLVDSKRNVVPVYSADTEALARVQTPAARVVPDDVPMLGEPMPMLLSGAAAVSFGGGTDYRLGGAQAARAGITDSIAAFTTFSTWVFIDAAYYDDITTRLPLVTTLLVDLEPGTDPDTVIDAARAAFGENVRSVTPASASAQIDGSPASSGLRVFLLVCILAAAVLCAIAVVMTLVLGTRARTRILALLQTLGAPPRAGGGIVTWELWPVCAAALAAGALFGALLPVLLLRVVDLRPFTGASSQPGYVADPLILSAAIGGFLAVAALFTLVALLVTKHTRAATVLRTVEET